MPLYTLENYGAVGDGTTDDSAAIQACHDAILSNGHGGLVVPRNRIYIVNTPISITAPGIRILGAGWDQTNFIYGTVFKAGASIAQIFNIGSGAEGFELQGCSLNGNGTCTSAVLTCDAQNSRLLNNHIRRPGTGAVGVDVTANATSCWLDTCRINGANQASTIGIQVNATDAIISGCKPVNLKFSVKLLSASGAQIIGNHFTPGSGTNIGFNCIWLSGAASNLIINDNRFDNQVSGAPIQLDPSSNCFACVINGNLFYQTGLTNNTFAAIQIDFTSAHFYGVAVTGNVVRSTASQTYKSLLASQKQDGTAASNPTRMASDGVTACGNVAYVGTGMFTDNPLRAVGNVQSTDGTTWASVTDI